MSKPRNHAAEYARRIERAVTRGLSRSQARGHAKAGESPIKVKKAAPSDMGLNNAVKVLHRTGTLTNTARELRMSPERLRRYLNEQGLARRQGRSWVVTDQRIRVMKAYVDRQLKSLRLQGFDVASLNGRHLAAVGEFLRSNNPEPLQEFVGLTVTDTAGKPHTFETDPNKLYELAHAGSEPFEQVYRLILP